MTVLLNNINYQNYRNIFRGLYHDELILHNIFLFKMHAFSENQNNSINLGQYKKPCHEYK